MTQIEIIEILRNYIDLLRTEGIMVVNDCYRE